MDKPAVTNEHLKKYDEIMKTSTKGSPTPPPVTDAPPPTPVETKLEEKPKAETEEKKPEPQPTTNPGASALSTKGFVFTGHKIMTLDGKEKKEATIPGAKKHSSKPLLIIVALVLLVGWGVFWAYFFGYFKF